MYLNFHVFQTCKRPTHLAYPHTGVQHIQHILKATFNQQQPFKLKQSCVVGLLATTAVISKILGTAFF